MAAAVLVDQGVTDRLTDEAVRGRIMRWLGLPAAAGAYFVFLAILASFPNRRRLCVGFLAAVLSSTLITHALKWSIGRARPRLELGPLAFQPWSGAGYFDSFPSGHSAAAATLAVLLGIYFPKARWVFYIFAGLWGLERIMDNWHFLSDVLAGYVVGACAVWACIGILGSTYYEKNLPSATARNA